MHVVAAEMMEYAVIAALQKRKPCGKTILIKGSNGIKLNTVVDYL